MFILGEKQHILLHFRKVSWEGALENTCGKSSSFIKATGCKNYSKVSYKMAYSL